MSTKNIVIYGFFLILFVIIHMFSHKIILNILSALIFMAISIFYINESSNKTFYCNYASNKYINFFYCSLVLSLILLIIYLFSASLIYLL